MWLALRQVGAGGYRTMIGDDMRAVAGAGRRGRGARRSSSCSRRRSASRRSATCRPICARAIGDPAIDAHLDALNRELLDRLQRGGELFVSNAVVGGRYALRACIVNFHTTAADVDAIPGIVVRVGRAVADA